MQAHNAHYIHELSNCTPSKLLDHNGLKLTIIYFSIKIRNIRRRGSAAPHNNWSPTVKADK